MRDKDELKFPPENIWNPLEDDAVSERTKRYIRGFQQALDEYSRMVGDEEDKRVQVQRKLYKERLFFISILVTVLVLTCIQLFLI